MSVQPPPCHKYLNRFLLRDSYYRNALLIFGVTFLCYVLFHASRKPISVVKGVLHGTDSTRHGWAPFNGANWSQLFGVLEYTYLLVYSLSMIASGYIAERVSLRRFMCVGMVLSGLTNVAFGVAQYFNIHSYTYFIVVQLLSGVFQSTGWPVVITLMSNWWGKSRRGFVMGLWNAHTSLGNILGSLVAGFYVEQHWGASFAVPGLLLICGALLVHLTMLDHPDLLANDKNEAKYQLLTNKPVSCDESKTSSYRPVTFLEALFLPHVLSYSAALFFGKLVSYTFLYWLPNYLSAMEPHSLSLTSAAQLSVIFDLGGILGGVLAGIVSDSRGGNEQATLSRRAVTCATMLAIAAPMLCLYRRTASASSPLSLVLLFGCGLLVNGPYALITTAVSVDLGNQSAALNNRTRALATITAIVDATGSMGAALGPFLTGLLVSYGWSWVFSMLVASDLLALFIVSRVYCSARRHRPSLVAL